MSKSPQYDPALDYLDIPAKVTQAEELLTNFMEHSGLSNCWAFRGIASRELVNQLERELTAAQARIAELEQDKARLDWLEKQFSGTFRTSIFIAHELGGSRIVLDQGLHDPIYGKTAREAIDAARKDQP